MKLNKVWLWGVLGVVLGALVSNVDRFLATRVAEPAVPPVEVAPEAQPEVTPPVPAPKPTPAPAPKVEAPKVVKATPEVPAIEVLRVVVEEDRVAVAFTAGQRIYNAHREGMVTVEPAVEHFDVAADWRGTLSLTGNFKAQTTYQLRIKEGVASYGGELKKPFSTSFYVEKPFLMDPQLEFLSHGEFLPLHRAELPYEVRNVDAVEVTLRRAYESNLIPLGTSDWRAVQKMTEVASQRFPMDVEVNTPTVKMLDVGALAERKPGFYQVRLQGFSKDGERLGFSIETEFLLTDLGVVYAYDHLGKFQVATYRLSDGTPVGGATVEVASSKGQVLYRGATNAEGIASPELCAEPKLRDEPPEGLLIRAGEDITYVNLRHFLNHRGRCDEWGAGVPVRATAWTDRDAVRPGERVQCAAIVRDHELKALAQLPLKATLRDPRGQEVQSVTLTTDVHGFAQFEAQIPSASTSGSYTVMVRFGEEVVATSAFYVSDFVPDRMRVEVGFGEGETVNVKAETYFGTEVDGAKGSVNVTAVPQRTVSQWPEWVIGKQETESEDLTRTFVTKVAGTPLVVSYEKPDVSDCAPLRINATATLSEPGGRAVTAYATTLTFPHTRYIGVREDDDGRVQLKLLAQKDAVVPAEAAELSLIRHDWEYLVVREGSHYRYKWEERKRSVTLPNPSVTLSTETETVPDFTTLASGQYTLTVKLGDGQLTEYSFWHRGGEAGKRSANPSILTFETDKPTYRPGDIATLTFEVPAAGTVLLCEGAQGLQAMRAQRVVAGTATVTTQIPLTQTHNTWTLGVTYVADASERQTRLFGTAELSVALDTVYGLKVAIDAAERTRPGEQTTVKVKLATPEGQPAQGTVVLVAVDEGILALTNYQTPNLLKRLTKTYTSGFDMGDIYGKLYPHLKILPDGRIGGGVLMKAAAMDNASAKRARGAGDEEEEGLEYADIPRVICPPIRVPASGEAEVTVTTPANFQGALRWMAVAANETRMGSAEKPMVVRSEATLLASTVRFGCPGDKAEVTLQMANHDLDNGDYEVLINGEVIERGTLAKGATKTLVHPMDIGDATATLRIGGMEVTEKLPVRVRPAVPEILATTFKLLKAGEPLPEGATKVEDVKDVLTPVLDWLSLYPYRCSEQLSARALPYIFRDPNALSPAEKALVTQTTSHLLARLNADGNITVWPGANYVSPEATVLASLALLKAEAQGHITLAPATHKLLVDALQLRSSALRKEDRGTAAFAAWVLAEVGERVAPTAARNLLATSQDDAAAFLAAAALIRSGNAGEGTPILRKLLTHGDTRTAALECYMDTAAQRALEVAIALQCGLGAELPEQTIATFFTAPRETTQQNVWTAIALQALGTALPEGTLVRTTEARACVRPNQPILVKRAFVNRDGTPVTEIAHGELVYLRVDITMPKACRDLAIRHLLPGGLEFEDAALATRETMPRPKWAEQLPDYFSQAYTRNLGSEVQTFGQIYAGETTLLLPVRAVARGTFANPVTAIEAMYDPTLTGAAGGEGTITIR